MSGKILGENQKWSTLRTRADSPPLELNFGSSCKPYKLLECKDVHPCPTCRGDGCAFCGQTGVGPMRFGSASTCAVCLKSGKDHKKWLQRTPETDPEPEPEPTKTPEVPEPEAPLTRKQKRAAKYGSCGGQQLSYETDNL